MELVSSDALLVIDMQNDFCPGGALPVAESDGIIPTINALGRRFEHVIVTQDWHPLGHISFASSHQGKKPLETVESTYGMQVLWPDHCVKGTRGAELHEGLELKHTELILRKGFRREIDSYSAFLENDHRTHTGLAGYLRDRGLKRLFVCGLAYDFCVRASAVDGQSMGFEIVVIEDAARSVFPSRRSETEAALGAVVRIQSREIL